MQPYRRLCSLDGGAGDVKLGLCWWRGGHDGIGGRVEGPASARDRLVTCPGLARLKPAGARRRVAVIFDIPQDEYKCNF